MRKCEILEITSIRYSNNLFEIEGKIKFDIVKCIISQDIILRESNLPEDVKKLYETGDFKGKNILIDTSNAEYAFETIRESGEEFYVPTSVSGLMVLVKVLPPAT